MISSYQKELLDDFLLPESYGKPLAAWKGQTEFFQDPAAPKAPGALSPSLAATFVEQAYVLLKLRRAVRVYRGYESAGLRAPYGVDHPSFYQGLVSQRRPGTPDGLWWSPSRPSLSIDHLGLGSIHRADDRARTAIKLEWNRLDHYIEAVLPPDTLVYAGRVAPQQESPAYGGKRYGGSAMQFRLMALPTQIIKTYAAE